MVEHNLAKVGVASSNLVSRSILLLFIFLTPLISFAKQSIIIKDRYCITNNALTLKDIYPSSKKDTIILSVLAPINSYKVPSIDIIAKVKKYISLPIKDNSGGIVTLDKQCFIKYFKDDIKRELKKAFKHKYNSIKIKKVYIKPINAFPNDFTRYKFDNILIKDYSLRKNSGNFLVIYKKDNSKIIRIFFKYKILAKISLFKAKHNIQSGKILSQNDYEKMVVNFDKVPLNFAKDLKSGAYISKNYIKKDSIITEYMIKKMTLVKKRDMLRSIINDGGLQIEFFSKALEDGNKGDIIKTVGKNGKLYRAKIVGKGLVIIQ